MRTNVVLIRDHSASMRPLVKGAMADFNLTLDGLKAAKKESVYNDIRISVVECGVGFVAENKKVEVDKPVELVDQLITYTANGSGTPLWDAVMMGINTLNLNSCKKVLPIQEDIYLVMVITDGLNNRGITSSSELSNMIRMLQATDKWTFVFRVPVGYKKEIVRLGIPDGNIVEWEQTEVGIAKVAEKTYSGTQSFMRTVASGEATSTKSYYTTDLSNVKLADVKSELTDITFEIDVKGIWTADEDVQIRDFCEKNFGEYVKGKAFYQLTKPELVQSNKKIILKHLKKGRYFCDSNYYTTRDLLSLPISSECKVRPGDHGDFEIYIQSTSVNRKLKKNTKVLYWKNA